MSYRILPKKTGLTPLLLNSVLASALKVECLSMMARTKVQVPHGVLVSVYYRNVDVK